MTRDLRPSWKAAVGVVLAALLLVGFSACGDDDDTSQPDAAVQDLTDDETEATADLCDAGDELAFTIEMLKDVDVVEGGTSALEDALSDVSDAVDDVADVAGDDVRGEVDAVQSAFDEVEGAVDSFDQADSPSAAIESVSQTVADLAAAAGALGDELRDGCE